jgi:putative ATP-dependent endonuclease of OLD family
MKITTLHIDNYRSIRSLDVILDDTTVFIGPNNAGKSAILESVRISLTRRWGTRGTGFTEADVHLTTEQEDPRTAPPVKIGFVLEEPSQGGWPTDMVTELNDIMTIMPNGLNRIAFNVSYVWSESNKNFESSWEFLDSSGQPLTARRRSMNLSNLFNYLLFFWLGALRDADDEFGARSRHWGSLLRSISIPSELESEIKDVLDALDKKLLSADSKFEQIADTIGRATEIAVGDTPGTAKLRMSPIDIWDMLSRACILVKNEGLQPWLSLDHHGQGLQSLSVIFLFQAAVTQKLSEGVEGAEPIFAIEEPEAHLHPQAARTLWDRISQLPGQKLVTTHSPYFVQNVPLHNLRIVRSERGSSTIASIPRRLVSQLPWTKEVADLVSGQKLTQFLRDESSGYVAAKEWFDEKTGSNLSKCWSKSEDFTPKAELVGEFRHSCRILVSASDELELSFFGRRLRGEIFFGQRWLLVEGVSEYLLVRALGRAFDYDLDQHGVSIIDFQNNGSAGVYASLADAFSIPWVMVVDGDSGSKDFKRQLLNRGFSSDDLVRQVITLTEPNNLEDQLICDGHEMLLRGILQENGVAGANSCSVQDLKKKLKKNKTLYMRTLASQIVENVSLAEQMPVAFVTTVKSFKVVNQ